MSFFDRRKGDERRLNGRQPNGGKTVKTTSERRNGTDRRAAKDRRLDSYHQLDISRRKVIYQIIEILEKHVGD